MPHHGLLVTQEFCFAGTYIANRSIVYVVLVMLYVHVAMCMQSGAQ